MSCGALERSNSPYIESFVESCVFKNQKEIFACGFDWEENPEKVLRQWKSIHELKAEFVYLIL